MQLRIRRIMQKLRSQYCRQLHRRRPARGQECPRYTSTAGKSLAILFALLAFTVLSLAAPPAISTADPHRYLDDIKALTTPAMEGRGAGSKGLTRAEHLIEKRYKNLGLEPAGTNSYLQPFTVITGAHLKGKNSFAVLTGDQKRELKPKRDFVPFSFSASGAARGPLVFAGYGASADEFQYDDYAGIDVKDKIVLLLRHEPHEAGPKGKFEPYVAGRIWRYELERQGGRTLVRESWDITSDHQRVLLRLGDIYSKKTRRDMELTLARLDALVTAP